MQVKVKKLHAAAILPQYATAGAACFDLFALPANDEEVAIHYGGPQVIPTGLAFEIPAGHVMLIFSRSGHGFKSETRLANCVGVIDSDYRGEVMVKLTRDPNADTPIAPLRFRHGDRIAQAMVVPFPRVSFVEAVELSDTERGAGGFGSTGQ
jgi:dUTP pyrophosphatase